MPVAHLFVAMQVTAPTIPDHSDADDVRRGYDVARAPELHAPGAVTYLVVLAIRISIYKAVPNKAPMPAVIAIARAPQKVTRTTPIKIRAPPV